ncbi:MAG: T9SS type A sorting domain-containing protein [Flavobacteriaceae bacterium]|nr:T9SS type A sorting domain-containing protein [Flavobacteriaceae bacterium]
MKKYLHTYITLSLFLSFSSFAQFDGIPTGSGYYINKLIPSPSGGDLSAEYIEIRGTANEIIPSDLYLIVIEGDGESGSLGKVTEAISLGDGTRSFGSNGVFAIVSNYQELGTSTTFTNGYAALIDQAATVLVIELSGTDSDGDRNDSGDVSTKTPDIGYDGNLSDGTATYMLVSSTSNPKNVRIDGATTAEADGIIDNTGDHTSWTLYDSYSFLDDDGNEYAYGQIIFVEDSAILGTINTTTSATVVNFDIISEPTMVLRQGTNTGYTIASDWVAACKGSGGGPQWQFSGTGGNVQPDAFVGWDDLYLYYGKVNPTALTLSVSDFSSNGILAYPNPTEGMVHISGKESVDAIRVFNISGQLIKEVTNTNALDLTSQRSGLYMIEIEDKGKTSVSKLIKR